MNKNKHRSKTASIMLFSFACLALTGCTLHDTLNKPQAETIVDLVETPHKRNIIKRDNPTPTQETWIMTDQNPTKAQWVQAAKTLGITDENSGNYDLNNSNIGLGISQDTPDLTIEIDNQGTIYTVMYDINDPSSEETWDNTFSLTITEYPQELYDALYPQQESMGEQIIDSVESGLGMIGTLATQFLTGFSALFWNAASSQLTAFGTFSLVFLGIAITFAIIKLILNIVRSNTGA